MIYQISPHEQGSAEWKADRCGRATGSAIAAIFAETRASKPAAARADYCMQLVLERLTGTTAESFTNEAMTEQDWAALAELDLALTKTKLRDFRDLAVKYRGAVA